MAFVGSFLYEEILKIIFYDFVGIKMKTLILYIKHHLQKVLFSPSDLKRDEYILRAHKTTVGPRLCNYRA